MDGDGLLMSGGKLSPESPPVLPSLVQLPPPCPLRPQCQAQPLFSPGGGKQALKSGGCAGGHKGHRGQGPKMGKISNS